MEDPSIRTHDVVFEQVIAILGIFAVLVIVCGLIVAYMIHRDRRQ